MDITIIGTGNMARAIATRALAGRHNVTLVGHESGKAERLAGELGGSVATSTIGDALTGDVVVLALHYGIGRDVASSYGDQLDGKVVVDISNAVDFSTFEPITVQAGSAAQEIAAAVPQGAKVVKAFNTTFAGTLVDGEVAGHPLDVFVASDDEDAKATVSRLATDGGLRALDAGPLRRARELEALGYLHMAVSQTTPAPFATAVKLVH